MKGNILFICGSINQTSQMHQVSEYMQEYNCYFTPYYLDGVTEKLRKKGLLEFTIAGNKLATRCLRYLYDHGLSVDMRGSRNDYDLVFTCNDLYMPQNIQGNKIILVQEGMTDPENLVYYMVKSLKLPRYLASTSTTGLSHTYDYFCVASEGYRDLFLRKGVDPATLRVTGIPNFDNCARFYDNDFPHHNYVLVATSDMRETFKWENRKKFIRNCLEIADGRQLIFKLHPNENMKRAIAEINKYAPDALVYSTGNTDHMIANCDVLITRYSSVVYVGLALQKEVYSDFDVEKLQRMTPIQNGGASAHHIALIAHKHLNNEPVPDSYDAIAAESMVCSYADNPGQTMLKCSG